LATPASASFNIPLSRGQSTRRLLTDKGAYVLLLWINVRETAYWVALLRCVGCTGHAHEVGTVVGDEKQWDGVLKLEPEPCRMVVS